MTSSEDSPVLATYGTLMRGFGMIERLGIQHQLTFVEPCRWQGLLYDLGAYPGAVPGDGLVHGEMFRLSSSAVWSVLDHYEGYDPDREAASRFVRRRVSLDHPDRAAWVYWFNGETTGHPQVPSGDWAAYVGDED
jgi:gamma-glutamylcyclotransferase (GGCT)/AIG2-like uncharacterized protein YtfP